MNEQAPNSDRREFPRIPLLTEVWLVVGKNRLHVKSRDLSRGGLCLEDGNNALDVGDELELELRLPEQPIKVSCRGRVMWQSPGLAGIMFLNLPVDAADEIDAACEHALAELKSFENEKTPERSAD